MAGLNEKNGPMNLQDYQQLVEVAWRRKLTPAETRCLQSILDDNPTANADWLLETALTSALGDLRDRPLPSNFTAQVLLAVRREEGKRAPDTLGRWISWKRWRWQPIGWAVAGILVVLAGVNYQRMTERQRMIADLASIPPVTELPSAEVLQDFDAILHLGQVPGQSSAGGSFSDEELLAALR